MEVIRSSETTVHLQAIRRYTPENGNIQMFHTLHNSILIFCNLEKVRDFCHGVP
jgi:hypothetical protein